MRLKIFSCFCHLRAISTLIVEVSHLFFDNRTSICGDTRLRKFPTVSRHKARYLKSAMPTSLRCHRYPYGSFAELSEDRTRGSRRGLLNKRARYRWLTKKWSSVAFESKRFSLPRAAKCEGLRDTSVLLLITCVKHWSLPSALTVNC